MQQNAPCQRYVTVGNVAEIIDRDTYAAASFPDASFTGVAQASMEFSGHGVFAGYTISQQGSHFVGRYWQDSPMHLMMIDTRTVPPLHC